MSQAWKTVRVFISSTFRDMQSERDWLVRFVFPKLRQELLRRRIHLVDVDLRWGVTSEQDALSVCREVVDECRPRFLCMLGGRYGWVPPGKTRSITAEEVYYGVLDRDLKSRGFAFFYFRDPSATAAMIETEPGEFREPAGSLGAGALAELVTAIVDANLQPFVYRAKWDIQSRRLTGLKEFGDRVYADLTNSIDQEFGTEGEAKPDNFAEESAAMEAFIEEHVQRFVLGSRRPIWMALMRHAESADGNGCLCLTGAAGSGKSALLGKFYQDYREAHPQDLVIPHFVGASLGSTDLRLTFRRLCHELVIGAGLKAEIPEDSEKLRAAFAEILQQASARKRVVILLDAINQLDPTAPLAGWSWLPDELPPTARIILSTLSGAAPNNLRLWRRPPRSLQLQPLDATDREAVVREFLHRYRKIMTEDQRAALMAKDDAGTPLYLLVALEELRTLGTYEEMNVRIEQLPPDTRALFVWILKRLMDDDGFRDASGQRIGRELVSRFVSLLGASRHGLSQQELVEMLSPGDREGNVAALARLLRPYLMQRGELFDFYHGQFREAATQAYLNSDEEKIKVHTELAEYFHSQAYWREPLEEQRRRAKSLPPTPRPVNVRKVDELPWQRVLVAQASRRWRPLEELFGDLDFLEAKTEAGFIIELIADFQAAINVLPAKRPWRRVLRALEAPLRRDAEFVRRHPTTLFQQLWNTCRWYEDRCEAKVWTLLRRLLEEWRSVRGLRCERPWLRSLFRPPAYNENQRWVFSDIGDDPKAVISPCGRYVASGSRIWNLASGTQESTVEEEGHSREIISFSPDGEKVAVVEDEKALLICNRLGYVIRRHSVWRSGRDFVISPMWSFVAVPGERALVVRRFDGREDGGPVNVRWPSGSRDFHRHPVFSQDEKKLAVGFYTYWRENEEKLPGSWMKIEIRVLDPERGIELSHLDGAMMGCELDGLALSPNGDRCVFSTHTNLLRTAEISLIVWDPLDGTQRMFKGYPAEGDIETDLSDILYSPDGTFFAVAGSASVQIFEATGAFRFYLRGHEQYVRSIAISGENRLIASTSNDKTLRVWQVPSLNEMRDDESPIDESLDPGWDSSSYSVNAMSFSPDGRFLAAAFGSTTSGETRVFSVDSGELLKTYTLQGSDVLFSPDSRWIGMESEQLRGVTVERVPSHHAAEDYFEDGYPAEGDREDDQGDTEANGGSTNDRSGGNRDPVFVSLYGSIKFTPDSYAFVSNGAVHRVADGALLVELDDVPTSRDFCLAPDGALVAVALSDGAVFLWDARTGRHLKTIRADGASTVSGVCFSLDGRYFSASDYSKGRDFIWNSQTWEYADESPESIGCEGPVAAELRAFGDEREVRIESPSGTTVASTPGDVVLLQTHPKGNLWAGAIRHQLLAFRLENAPPDVGSQRAQDPRVATAIRRWDISTAWADELTVRCPWCGELSIAPPSLKQRTGAPADGLASLPPVMAMNPKEWDNPALVYECSACGRPIRLNPFAVDLREVWEAAAERQRHKAERDLRVETGSSTDARPSELTIDLQFLPQPHPSADPDRAFRLNVQYQEELARWKALSWWGRHRAKKPEPPRGI